MVGPTLIREATEGDASAMAAIHVKTWRAAYVGIMPADFLDALCEVKHTAFWRKELACGTSTNRVAVADGEIIGWASGGASRDPDADMDCEVYAIYVSPDSWNQGTGQQLMSRLENDLPNRRSLMLWVLEENQHAIGFYTRLGFAPDGTTKTLRIGGRELVEIRLRK